MKEFRRLLSYLGPYRRDMAIGALLVLIETVFELVIPVLMADLIDVGVANQDLTYIVGKGVQMGVCALLALATGLLYARFAARAAYGWGARVREAQYEKVQRYAFSNLDRFETSSLVTRMTTDVTVLQNAVNGGLRPLVRSPVMLVMGLGLSFWMNAELALIFLVCAPVLGLILFCVVRKVAPMYGRLQKAVDRLNNVVQEGLTAIRAVKAFVRGAYEEEKFRSVNEELMATSQRTFHLAVLNLPAFQFTMYSAVVLILWFGGGMILKGGLQVGELTGFLSYVMQILNSLMMISNVFLMLTRSLASATRIMEVIDEVPDITDEEARDIQVEHGAISFDHVWFKYSQDAKEYILSDVTFDIRAGETVGIIGQTGSAKSTLIQLIPRLYDATEGEVRIDGIPVRQYPMAHLRDAIAVVLQKNTLFSGTLLDNLKWGKEDATMEEVEEACRIACVDEFIDRLADGYQTEMGQGGVNVSGGQKQRLCIARAILKSPKVLILDDSTSAVDTATEGKIRQGLKEKLPDMTKIIIAQRISSVRSADRIILLDDGHVSDIGTHEELLGRSRIYQEIYESQKEGADL